ncbi:MAG: tetratricopeptide repeat protein [Candidatus Sericytochromatia bacterium]|nr:tetratricopeptide repeat protein [Candidatus Sericytochromatia bacterium]
MRAKWKSLLLGSLLSFSLLLPAAAQSRVSLVILPFKNISQNPADDWLQESFSENLGMGLGHLPNLHLVERAALRRLLAEQQFSQTMLVDPETAPKLGRMVGARYVVLGNYQRLGRQLLINVKVVDTETGTVESGQMAQVSGDFSQLFQLQEELAGKLMHRLQLNLPQQNTAPAAPAEALTGRALSGTRSTEAHEYYIKARLFRDQLGEKNIQKAIGLLNLALSEDPGYARAVAELAGVYLDRASGREVYRSASADDLTQAEKFARQAVALAPESASGYSVLARVLQARSQSSEALQAAEQALTREKTSESILTYLQLKYPSQSQVPAAEIEAELRKIGADLQDPQVLFRLGGLYFNALHSNPQADLRQALSFYTQAHQKNPRNPYYAFTLSAVHMLQGRSDQARQILRPLLEAQPEHVFLLVSGADAASRLLPDLGQLDPDQRLMQRYPEYSLAYAQLATLYQQQQKENPDNLTLLLTGVPALYKLLPEESLAWLTQATRLNPDAPEAYLQLARLYLQQGKDPRAADRWFQQGLARLDASPETAYSAALYLMARQKPAEAESYLQRALQHWQTDADPNAQLLYWLGLNRLAQLKRQQNQPEAALKLYTQLTQSPLPPMQKGIAWQRMAEIYATQNRFEAAFAAYENHLRHVPAQLQSQQARNIYGGYFARKALQKDPQNPQLLNDAGLAYLLQGELATAEQYLQQAVRLAPANAVIHYNLGLVWLGRQNPAQARASFEQAVRLDPRYAKAWYNLGVACDAAGQRVLARQHWQQALNLNPGLQAAREALQ